MNEIITRITRLTVMPKGEAIFCEQAFNISIEDNAGGEYVQVSQCNEDVSGCIKIDTHEWPDLKAAIEKMVNECQK